MTTWHNFLKLCKKLDIKIENIKNYNENNYFSVFQFIMHFFEKKWNSIFWMMKIKFWNKWVTVSYSTQKVVLGKYSQNIHKLKTRWDTTDFLFLIEWLIFESCKEKYLHFSIPLYLGEFSDYEYFESTFLGLLFCVEYDAVTHLFQNWISIIQKPGFHFFSKQCLINWKTEK